jgi:hypothetical protein
LPEEAAGKATGPEDKEKAAQEEANLEEKGSLFVGKKTAIGKTACNEGDPFAHKS